MIAVDEYGNVEVNPISEEQRELHEQSLQTVYWSDPSLKKITRLRLLSDPGCPFWDVSYCYGELQDGTPVDVQLPFGQLPRKASDRNAAIIAAAKEDGIYAKGLGIFDPEVISTLS